MANPERVFITGLGPVTGVGVGRDSLWESLRAGRVNVGSRALTVDVGRTAELPVVSMPAAEQVPGLKLHLDFLAEQDSPGFRDLAYALLAIELALADAGLGDRPGTLKDSRMGLVQAFEAPGVERTVSTLFGMMADMAGGPPPASGADAQPHAGPHGRAAHPPGDSVAAAAWDHAGASPEHASAGAAGPLPDAMSPPAGAAGPPPVYEFLAPFFYNMQPFVYVHLAGKAFELRGFSTSVHNACTSGALAIEIAAERIRRGQADVMLVAGGEAFDTGVRLEWFRRLGLYAQQPSDMKPFDSGTRGFYVGEGAGAILLESRTHAAARNARVYAEYLGGAFHHQAWKQTVPDVRAARLATAIRGVLEQAGAAPSDIDLIVPHGAATNISDGYEAECISKSLGEMEALGASRARAASGPAWVTAFKPYIGHMLAASGIIDTICGLLAMDHGVVPATPNSSASRSSLPCPLAVRPIAQPIRTMLKLSTGFTGHDAALLFARPT